MSNSTKQILITVPESPYKILGVDFDASGRQVQTAFRAYVRQNFRKGPRAGKNASKKLTDPKERMKADVFCCPADIPQVDLNPLKEKLQPDDGNIYCRAVEDPVVFCDLYFPDHLPQLLSIDEEVEEIEYRSTYMAGKKRQEKSAADKKSANG